MQTPPPDPVHTDFEFGEVAALLPGTEFERCTFRGTRLQEADLADCRFVDCVFEGANLSLARMDDCTFQGVTFRSSKLVGVDWTAARRLTAVRFETCDVTRSAFVGLDLRRLVMTRCRARETIFSEADLSDADLSGTDFEGASFGGARLPRADLRDATGYALSPALNDLRGARVSLPEAAALLEALGIRVGDGDGDGV